MIATVSQPSCRDLPLPDRYCPMAHQIVCDMPTKREKGPVMLGGRLLVETVAGPRTRTVTNPSMLPRSLTSSDVCKTLAAQF